MYDSLSATSIPSDIHLICSTSPVMSAQQQLLCGQMFGSLADVIGYQPHYQLGGQLHWRHELRNSKSSAASTTTASYQDHLLQRAQQRRAKTSTRAQREQQQPAQQQHYDHLSRLLLPDGDEQTRTQPACQQHYLTIEELRTTRNSCWLCGCNWQQDHVSLDCPECDGYALSRPCPSCDGKCKQIWQRNISATHDKHRALWTGRCALQKEAEQQQPASQQQQQQQRRASTDLSASVACNASAVASAGSADKPTSQHRLGAGKRKSNGHSLAPSSSSVCSSHPSSAASSDDEHEDFLSM